MSPTIARSVALLLSAVLTAPALGQRFLTQGQLTPRPLQKVQNATTHTYSPLSGLRVTVDTQWFPAGGSLPVEVLLESQQPAASEKTLVIRFVLPETGRVENPLVVEREVTLAAGASSVRQSLLLPRVSNQGSVIRWQVLINGTPDKALSEVIPLRGLSEAAAPPLRIVAPTQRDRFLRGEYNANSLPGVEGLFGGRVSGSRTLSRRRFKCEAADNWLAYSAADVAALSIKQLENLAADQPDQLTALRRWVLAGGTLWVENAGLEPDRLSAIDATLGITGWRHACTPDEQEPDEPPPTVVAKEKEKETGEEPDEGKKTSSRPEPIAGAPGWGYQRVADDELQAVLRAVDQKRAQSSSRGWYALRNAGFGRVVAFERSSWNAPSRMRFGELDYYLRSMAERDWTRRHGLQPGVASAQFGNLLIPGVGVAPVGAFQVVVTLFVLIIGPLNYWLLWRRRQLQMLVLTVPLGALLSTVGLFAYAGLADGFGVKARARSVTLIDQARGEAVSWSRVSHYVATLPGEPATIPADTAIYPIRPGWEATITSGSRQRSMTLSDRGQTLTSGWLPPRNAVQHLLIRSSETEARLVVSEEGETTRVSNRLGSPLELLLVRTAEGGWGRAEGVAADGAVTLEATTRSEAMKEFRLLAISNEPEFPVGAGKSIEATLERLDQRGYARRLQNQISSVSLGDSLGELEIGRLTGLSGDRGLDLPPRSYIAVTRETVATPLGWDSVQEVGSFHVVAGRW